MASLISDKIELRAKKITRERGYYYINFKGVIHKEQTVVLNRAANCIVSFV
jgi:hypothetical protein